MSYFKAILSKRFADNYVPVWMQWFYRIKLLICLVFCDEQRSLVPPEDYVHVVYVGGGVYTPSSEPTVHWFESLAVGQGVFKNWWWLFYTDSD